MMRKDKSLRQATESFVTSITNDDALVQDILTRVVLDCIKKYQSKVSVGVEDSVTDLLDGFKQKIVEEVLASSHSWTLLTKRESIIFPQGCRFLYTLGQNTFVVIEQQPGARTLSFDEGLSLPRIMRTDRFHRQFVALPYSIFILHFKNEEKNGTGVETLLDISYAWRPAPLASMNDMLYNAYLPNIHQNLSVCTGRQPIKSNKVLDGSMILKASEEAIQNFWNSNFNTDLVGFWQKKSQVSEIATLNEWIKNTTNNPLFILGIDMPKRQTLGDLLRVRINATEEQDFDVSQMRKNISNSIDKISSDLFKGITRYIHKTKFEKFYPKDIVQSINKALEPVAEQINILASGVELELNKLIEESEKNKKENKGCKKRGIHWRD